MSESKNHGQERRIWKRTQCNAEVLCQSLNDLDDGRRPGRVVDISRGGMRLLSPRRFECGRVLNVELQGELESFPNILMVRVVHVKRVDGDMWSHGCCFATDIFTRPQVSQPTVAEAKSNPPAPSVENPPRSQETHSGEVVLESANAEKVETAKANTENADKLPPWSRRTKSQGDVVLKPADPKEPSVPATGTRLARKSEANIQLPPIEPPKTERRSETNIQLPPAGRRSESNIQLPPANQGSGTPPPWRRPPSQSDIRLDQGSKPTIEPTRQPEPPPREPAGSNGDDYGRTIREQADRINELAATVHQLQEQRNGGEESARQIREQSDRLSELAATVHQLQEQRDGGEESARQIREQSDRLSELAATVHQLQEQRDGGEESARQIRERSDRLSELAATVRQLQEQGTGKSGSSPQLPDLTSQLHEVEEQRTRSEEALRQLRAQLESASTLRQDWDAEQEKARSLSQRAGELLRDMERFVEDRQRELESAENGRRQWESSVADLENERRLTLESLKKISGERERLDEASRSLSSEVRDMQRRFEDLKKERSEAEANFRHQTRQLADDEAPVKHVRVRRRSHRSSLSLLEQVLIVALVATVIALSFTLMHFLGKT